MTNTVLIKRSSTANAVPTAGNLQPGELAINYADGNLFYKNTSNVVTVIASNQFVSVSGNVTGNYIIGNGAFLTGLPAGYSNANVAAYLPTYTGNLNPGNLTTSGLISAAGNVSASGIVVAGSGGDISGAVNITATGNITGGNILTIGLVSAAGNVTGNYIIGNGAFLTGLPASYSNANVEAYLPTYAGNLNPGNILSTGFASVTGNVIGGNFVTTGLVTATGNITGSHFVGNGATLTSITGANVTGTVANANNATYAGTVTANDQLNITSVGTLTSLNVTGNISSAGNVTGNYILGNGAFLTGIPAGYSNSNVVAYGEAGWTGNIIPSGNGVYSLGNLTNPWKDLFVSGSTIYVGGAPLTLAAGNILQVSGQNVVYETSNSTISTTGDVDASNVATTGTVSAAGNITTQGVVSATGNILTDGIVSAVGNITANYFFGNGAFLTGISGGGSGSTISVDDFTGNGVQTRFPLAVAPPSIDFTTVNYNGIIQLRTGYTIDGANVVFTTPPANGSSIEVTTISSANVVTFAPAGTNTQVQFNNANTLGASSAFTFNTANNTVSTGNVEVTGNVTAAFFVGNGSQLTGIATSSYSNSNAAAYGEAGWTGNIVPSANLTYSLGNSTNWWANAWFASNTIYIGGVSVGVTGNTLTVNGNSVVTANATGTSTTTGNVSITGDVTGGNVLTAGVVSSTGNVTGNYILGNGRFLSGLPEAYSNANVATYLPGYNGNIAVSNLNVSNRVTSDLIPLANITYNLGNSSYRWNELWLASSTIYIGNSSISANADAMTLTNPAGGSLTIAGSSSDLVAVNVTATGNVVTGNLNGTGIISTTGNVTGGNVITGGLISATGTVTGSSLLGTAVSASANVTGGNILTGGLISATGAIVSAANITGGNVLTGGLISASSTITSSANIAGGNILTAGLISAASTITSAANITGGNVLTGGLVSATGTITSAANIAGGNVLTSGVISAASTITGSSLLGTVISASANVTGGNILTGGLISAVSTITGSTVVGTVVSAVANVVSGNIQNSGLISATGNIVSAANVNAASINATNWVNTANVSASGNVLVDGYISVVGNLYVANIVSSSNLVVQDPLVYLIANSTYPYNYDIGFYSQFTGDPGNTYQHTGLVRDYTDNTWKLFSNVPEPEGSAIDLANAIYDPLLIGALTASTGSFSGLVSSTGNIVGGNIRTAGLVTATGNITGGNVLTGGLISASSTITSSANIAGGNVLTSGVISAVSTITGGNLVTGGLMSATGNITSAANVAGGNVLSTDLVSGTTITASANITGGNLLTGGLISAASTVTGSSLLGSVVSASANITGGNVLTGGVISATATITSAANISGSYFIGNGSALTSITGANVTGTVANAAYATAAGSATTAGTVTTASQPNITSVGTLSSLTVTANVTGGNILTSGFISATGNLTADYVIGNGATLISIVGANVTGTVANATYATSAGTAGTVTTNAQPNITSVGSLTSLMVTGTANVGNVVTGGMVSAAGNITGSYLFGNGSQLTGITASATASGANTQIQFNDAGSLGASANLTFDKSTNTLNATTVTANGVPLATTGKAIAMAIVFGF